MLLLVYLQCKNAQGIKYPVIKAERFLTQYLNAE